MKKKPKNYHHGDLRNSLMKASLEILEREGADKLSLREAAKKACVSAAAPYRHFKSKDQLLIALAEEGFQDLEKAMQATAEKHPKDPQAQLLGLARTYLRLAADHPHFFRMMFSVDLSRSNAQEGIARACERVYVSMISLFQAGQASGKFRTAPPEEQGLLYWSTLHGYAMLLIDGKFTDLNLKIDQHIEQLAHLVRTMFRGLEK